MRGAKKQETTDEQRAPSQPSFRDNPLFVNSLQKGFEVLRAFSSEHRKLSMAEITRATGLDKSATQRFVFTLHSLGYLRKDEQSKLYSISPRMLEFGYVYLLSDYLVEITQPYLVNVHRRTGETVNLAVLDREDIIIVFRIPSNHVVSVNVHIGLRMPALYTAPGITICAFLEEQKRNQLLRKTKYRAHTESSIVDPAVMRETVRVAGEQGYSITKSQFHQGDISAAAPIFNGSGAVVAGISIAAPDTRITIEDARKKLVPEIVKAARDASIALSRF